MGSQPHFPPGLGVLAPSTPAGGGMDALGMGGFKRSLLGLLPPAPVLPCPRVNQSSWGSG